MSGFGCIVDRNGADVSSHRVERLSGALSIYGRASSIHCAGPLAIVVRHEDHGRARQRFGPVRDDRTGLVVAVAGRFGLADPSEAPGSTAAGDPAKVGCARWALTRWLRDGSSWLDEVAGSFTLVVADPAGGNLSVVRDHLGDLKVYYHLSDGLLIAASEAGAILRDESVDPEPDERSIARFLGFRFGHTDRSFFRGIKEVAPAHLLRVTNETDTRHQYWGFRPAADEASPDEIHRDFLGCVRRSMTHHVQELPADQIGLALGGGLDSTALAAMAPRGVRAFSWTFDTTPDPAEDANIKAVSRHLGLPVHWINGDKDVPLSGDFGCRFVHDTSPYINPFSALKRRLYIAARDEGCRRMMVGDAGDVLYGAEAYWLRDALTGLRPWAASSLFGTAGRALGGDTFARAAILRVLPIQKIAGAARNTIAPTWMTREGGAQLGPEELSPILPRGPLGHRYDLSVGARNIEIESEERRLFFQCGIERSNPFWHRPLLEMALRLPAYWFHRDGRHKILARETFRDLLPARVLQSYRVGLLGAFFLRGIEENRQWLTESVFQRPQSDWQRYVRRDWLEPHLSATDAICFGHTILWRVISYELWYRRVWGNGSAG